MIRIISGIYKGKRLKRVPSPLVRPMQDKLRGALFNILRDRVPGAVFLDGFSGTGSIGLEALSRGASAAVLVDTFHPSIKVLRDNIANCGAEDKAVVMEREYNRAVIDLARKGVKFDLIVLDPPYAQLKERNPLKVIRKRGILKPGGLIVLRHFDKIAPPRTDFVLTRQVRVGDDILSFYEDGAADAGTGGGSKAEPKSAAASSRLKTKKASVTIGTERGEISKEGRK